MIAQTLLPTIAELPFAAASVYGDKPALRFTRDGEWRDVSFTELADEVRQRLCKGVALNVHAQNGRRHAALQLARQPRLETKRIERRIADRLRSERIEPCGEMAVHPVRLDERHRGCDRSEELGGGGRLCRGLGRGGCGSAVATVRRSRVELAYPLNDGARLGQGVGRLLEELAPGRIDGFRGREILLEQLLDEAGIQVFELLLGHSVLCFGG